MCPTCYEHLGEEDCEDCNGTGKVKPGTELTPTISGLQARGENYMDNLKHGM